MAATFHLESRHIEPRLGRSVSIDQAAQLLHVSRRTIYNRIRDGRLVTIRTIGGSQRVLLDSLNELGSTVPDSTHRPSSRLRFVRLRATDILLIAGKITMTTHPPLASRAVRLTLSSLVCSGLLLATMTSAEAQSHAVRGCRRTSSSAYGPETPTSRASSSPDRANGSRGRGASWAAGRELLETGAVLDVPAGALEAVASDSEVDHCRAITWSKRTWR